MLTEPLGWMRFRFLQALDAVGLFWLTHWKSVACPLGVGNELMPQWKSVIGSC